MKDEGKIGLHLTTSTTIDLKDQRENARPKYFFWIYEGKGFIKLYKDFENVKKN